MLLLHIFFKRVFFILLFLSFSQVVKSQAPQDTIARIKEGAMTHFTYKGENLSDKEFSNLLRSKPSSLQEFQIAQDYAVVNKVLGFTAGLLIGYSLGKRLTGNTPNWRPLKVGLGFVVVSIPFNKAMYKHVLKSVRLFNSNV